MENLEALAKSVVNGHVHGATVIEMASGIVVARDRVREWRGSVAEWQAALLAALSAKFVEGTLVVTAPIESTQAERDKAASELLELVEHPVIVMREDWKAMTASDRDELLRMLIEFDQPHYPQLTDWVRAQPEGSRLLAVFRDGESIPAIATQDNHGKRLDDCYESALRGRMSGGLGYTAVWLSRETDERCETLIPRGVKVYRER